MLRDKTADQLPSTHQLLGIVQVYPLLITIGLLCGGLTCAGLYCAQLLPALYTSGNRGSEKLSDLPRVTWRVSGAGRIGTQGRLRKAPFPSAIQEPLSHP